MPTQFCETLFVKKNFYFFFKHALYHDVPLLILALDQELLRFFSCQSVVASEQAFEFVQRGIIFSPNREPVHRVPVLRFLHGRLYLKN